MKRIVPVVLVVILTVAGYLVWSTLVRPQTASNALAGSGTVETDEIALTPRIAGRILRGPEEEGVAVKKGEVLFTLDASLLELAVRQARAAVDAAKANVANAKDDGTDAEVAAAQAQLEQARVALEMAETQASYARIESPIDGVVSSIAARAGENAAPGSTLALVSDPASLTVTIFIPENRIGQVGMGQEGKLSTDSVDKVYRAKVVFIATSAEFTPASIETKDQRVKLVYQVKLRVTDPDGSLKPGMPADVVLR